MIPVVYINCHSVPFVRLIMGRTKLDETRTRDMLRAVVGRPVYVAETGNGPATVRCMVTFLPGREITSARDWKRNRNRHRVPVGSKYDWRAETRKKWAYEIADVIPVEPFTPPEGVRHGRVWMEYDETKGR